MRLFQALIVELSVLAAFCASSARASTVLDIPGPTFGYDGFGYGAIADSWTQNFNLTDGSITVLIQGDDPNGGVVHFYLTTDIGPTATLSDLVAFTAVDVPFALTSVTPFSDLDLGPGTYYLIAADYSDPTNTLYGPDWNYYSTQNNSGITMASGLTLNAPEFAGSLGPYAPAASFQFNGYETYAYQGVMTIDGTIIPVTTSVPEPYSSSLLGCGLLALGVFRRWRARN
jgi:hypothetical protein